MELIDTHAHLTFKELASDIDAVLSRSVAAGVTKWITVGTVPGEMNLAVDLAARHENMWAGLGYHPHYAKDVSEADIELLKELCANDKVVAIGETGLDFHYNFSAEDAQKQLFRTHLEIAAEFDKPVIVHTRNAFDPTMDILAEFDGKLKDVVIHCYSGTEEQTKLVLSRGYHVSFTGIVTFKGSPETRRAAAMVPLDRLMVETDCPYISPTPVRNQRPCEPAMLVHTAQQIADGKSITLEEFAEAATATSRKFFGI